MLLQGKVAIITGAASARGIGRATALTFAQHGARVVILDLDESAARDAAATLGEGHLGLGANVADETQVQAAVAKVVEHYGRIDILVNNAGIIRDRSLAKMTIDDWDSVITVNLRGAFLMSRELQPHMRAAGWGRIVNLSSTAALGNVGEANYSAAKSGVQGFTKSLALELGRYGITANAVAPGFVVTEMTRAIAERIGMSFDEMKQQQIDATAVGRTGQPEEIAHAVSFFADERSGFVTGQILYVAGGPRG